MPDDRIRFAHPGPASPAEARALAEACERVINSNSYILGAEVEAFEAAWATYVNVPGSVGVASGLDALEISLRALGVSAGDEVIVPAVSAMASALAVHRAGARPVFCDIDSETALLNFEHARSLVNSRTRAVLAVHLYGRAVDMRHLCDWAQAAGLLVVEDVAQAHGAVFEGRQVGTWGDAAAYSFYPTKNLGALGDAGAVVSTSPQVLSMARSLRNYGQTSLYMHEFLGLNSRLDEIQAAMLSVRLLQLRKETAERQAVAAQYFEAISSDHVLVMERPAVDAMYVAHIFAVRTRDREHFVRHMSDRGVDCLVHYPLTLPEQVAAGAWAVNLADTPVAKAHTSTCVSLPCRPGLSQRDINRIIDATNAYQP